MPANVRRGIDACLYRNLGTYAAPNWSEVGNLRDVTVNRSKQKADATTRANAGWAASVGTLKEGSIDAQMTVKRTADAHFEAFEDSYNNSTPVELLILNGPITESGVTGLRATFEVMDMTENQPMGDIQTADITLEIAPSDHAPEEYEVA